MQFVQTHLTPRYYGYVWWMSVLLIGFNTLAIAVLGANLVIHSFPGGWLMVLAVGLIDYVWLSVLLGLIIFAYQRTPGWDLATYRIEASLWENTPSETGFVDRLLGPAAHRIKQEVLSEPTAPPGWMWARLGLAILISFCFYVVFLSCDRLGLATFVQSTVNPAYDTAVFTFYQGANLLLIDLPRTVFGDSGTPQLDRHNGWLVLLSLSYRLILSLAVFSFAFDLVRRRRF